MKKLTFPLLLVAAILAGPSSVLAQHQRLSPHETISRVVEGNRITIVYGRPYTRHPRTHKVRKIWGGLVPYNRVWRVGADEATLFITQKPIEIGGTTVPAGAYTLFMLPEENGPSKLIINQQIGQWGLQYNQAHDLARLDLTKSAHTPAAHQFTMQIANNPAGGGLLKLIWEDTEFSIPFNVK